jgi:hypothetical protein
MEKEFIPYQQSLDMKKLGFDEPCFAFYFAGGIRYKEYKNSQNKNSAFYNDTVCSIPLYQQAFRFFRKEYNLLGEVYSNASGWLWEICDNIGGTHRYGSDWSGDCEESGMFTSFEKAELDVLKKLIEICKNK